MEKYNYYVYFVGVDHPKGLFERGDCGVGLTNNGPGIRDCRYGTMYVIPRDFVPFNKPSAYCIRSHAIRYFGFKSA